MHVCQDKLFAANQQLKEVVEQQKKEAKKHHSAMEQLKKQNRELVADLDVAETVRRILAKDISLKTNLIEKVNPTNYN